MTRQRNGVTMGTCVLLAFACGAVSASPAQAAERPAGVVEAGVHGQGRLRLVEGIPFLTLTGTYEEMGEQYGALMKERIVRAPLAPSRPLATERRQALESLLGPRLAPFVRGVATGLGIGMDDALRALFELPAQGCASILARAHPASGPARLLHAKNLDLTGTPLESAHAVVEFRPAGELRFVTTGILGLSDGMNERGLSLSIDAGQPGPAWWGERPPPGTEVVAGRMMDLLATARSLADADRAIRAAPVEGSLLLAVGSAAEGEGAIYDLAHGTLRRTGMSGEEPLFAANQYLHPDLTPPARLRECPRYRLLEDRLRGARVAGADDLIAALADPGAEYGVNNRHTRHSVVYDAGARVLRLALRPGFAAWSTWLEYEWANDRATVVREALFELDPVALRIRPPERVAAVREILPGYGDQVGLWAELDRALAQAGATRVGPGYTVYRGGVEGARDVEVVQPVVALGQDAGRVRSRIAEAAQVVAVTHRGPHSTLRAAHGAIAAWMEEHGYVASGPAREVWVRGSWNELEPRRWTTVVEVPVVPKIAASGSRAE